MICPNCGFNSPPGMRFCGNCGARLPQSEPAPAPPVRPFVDVPGDHLHEWMDPERRDRMRAAGLEAAGQRRNVTVLFADLSGYTAMSERLDTEDVYGMINQFLGILVEAVYKYEGTLDKITGDGIMALFGAPKAFENNAERAARTALEMQVEVQQFAKEMRSRLGVDPRMRIGLHSGEVVVGGVGSDLFMQYTAIGDTVNLARRMEEAAAPGSILVSHSVYRATEPVFEFEKGDLLRLKGIDEPVQSYLLTAVKQLPGSLRGIEGLQAPMIGRDAELRQLSEAIHALTEEHRGTVAAVTGEAGIGKSRLTREVKRLAAQLPVSVLEGSSLSYRRSISYWSFLQILRGYFDLAPNATEDETREKIAQKIGERLPEKRQDIQPYVEQLFVLRPTPGPGAERMSHLDPEQARQQTFIAVRDLLIAEARRRPLVLIFEDLHWVDGASQDLLLYLMDFVVQAPILFYCISRHNEGRAIPDVLGRARARYPDRLIRVELQHLSLEQSEQLTRELLALRELPAEFRQQIIRRAAGNPLYLEELLRMLIDRQIIRHDPEGWAIVPNAALPEQTVPDTLQGLILARFDRLDERDRRTLQIASVIGHEFNIQLLYNVLENEPGLSDAVEQLHQRDFIFQKDGAGLPSLTYAFKHVLTSETVYGTLLKRDRDVLHGKVAETIERLYSARLDEYVEMLAHHFGRSGDAEKALHYLIASGEKAYRVLAIPEARGYFEQARDLLVRVPYLPDQKYAILSSLGDILTHSGEYEQARQVYQDAVASVPRVDPVEYAERVGGLIRRIGMTFEKKGDYASALARLEEAKALVERAPRPLPTALARILNDAGWVYFQQGSMEEARERLQRALALVENGSDHEIVSSIYNRLGGVSFNNGELDEAAGFVRQSLMLRESIGDLFGAARSSNNLGVIAELRGDWDTAMENYRRGLELQEHIGDVEGTVTALGNIGVIYTNQGKFGPAEQALSRGLALAQSIKHLHLQGLALVNLGRIATEEGRASDGLPLLREAKELFKELNDHENLGYSAYWIGEAQLQLGQKGLAREAAVEALALFDQSGSGEIAPSPQHARSLRLIGAVMREDGDLDGSAGKLQESVEISKQLKAPLEQAKSLYELALTCRSRAEKETALATLSEARAIAEKIGAAAELKRIDRLREQLHPNSSDCA